MWKKHHAEIKLIYTIYDVGVEYYFIFSIQQQCMNNENETGMKPYKYHDMQLLTQARTLSICHVRLECR